MEPNTESVHHPYCSIDEALLLLLLLLLLHTTSCPLCDQAVGRYSVFGIRYFLLLFEGAHTRVDARKSRCLFFMIPHWRGGLHSAASMGDNIPLSGVNWCK